jgi:hypothetical protein
MINDPFPRERHVRFDPVSAYDHDASPRQFDTLWSLAGVLFIAVATAALVGEEWPANLVPASEAAESTTPNGALTPPRPNLTALVADIEVAPLSAEDVRHLQMKLEELGFAPGKIDGIAGSRTLNALNAYRESRNLESASAVDYGTAAGLLD